MSWFHLRVNKKIWIPLGLVEIGIIIAVLILQKKFQKLCFHYFVIISPLNMLSVSYMNKYKSH